MLIFIETFCYNMVNCLNICLCSDLNLMISNPFKQKEGRVDYYLVISVQISLVVAIIRTWSLDNEGDYDSRKIFKYFDVFIFVVFIIYVIYSFVYAYRKLSMPGISA